MTDIMSLLRLMFDDQLKKKISNLKQGLSGKRITPSMAVMGILLIWTYAIGITIGPFFGRIFLFDLIFTLLTYSGWGDYMVEGLLISCTYDFLTPVSSMNLNLL